MACHEIEIVMKILIIYFRPPPSPHFFARLQPDSQKFFRLYYKISFVDGVRVRWQVR